MSRGCTITAAALLATIIAAGAPPELKVPPKVRAVLDLANAARPEFHAWAILKILQAHDLVKDQAAQRALIEQAYELGASAQARYPVEALSGVPHDSLSFIRGQAGRLDLDSLSLQTRAVQFMLAIDKAKARQMFADIPKPSPAPLQCNDDLMPRLGEYYQALGRVAQETFTAKERQREEHVNFVLDYVGAITSPSQLTPVAAMLRDLTLSRDEKQLLYAKLGSAMEDITPDDRSFAEITTALTPLLNSDLMPAFQRLIANHASASRCRSDAAAVQPQVSMSGGAAAAPADEYTGPMLWHDPQAKHIGQMAFNLRVQDSRILTAADRADPAWQLAFENYLNALADWQQGSGESEAVFAHEKFSAYIAAADVAVTPESRARALADAMRLLVGSPLESNSPAEWFVDIIQADPSRHFTTDLLRACEDSGHPALALYAALVKLVGLNVVH